MLRTQRRSRPSKGGLCLGVGQVRASLPRGTPIEIWFANDARIGQKTKLTRRWAKRGTRPSAPQDQRTKSAYIFCCNLSLGGKGGRAHPAILQYRHDEPSLGRNLIGGCARRSRSTPHGPRRLTPDPKTRASVQYLNRANPFKKPELNPQENICQFMGDNWLLTQCSVPMRDCRSLHLRLESARRSAVEDHVHRPPRLDARVLINESWYNRKC